MLALFGVSDNVGEYTKSTLSGTDSLYDSDAAGNLTRIAAATGSDTDGDWRFYYDYENALTKAEKYVTDTWVTQGEYVRDANGRRVEKVADGTTIRYYYDGMRAIEETEGTGSPTVERQYVFGNGIDEALVMFDENGGVYDAYYYLADPLWAVEALVDESADIVEAYAYRAYGEPTIKTADGGDGDWFDGDDDTWFTSDDDTATTSALGNPYTFNGRRLDPETMLMYFRMRMYQPGTGSFISRDPIGYIDGMSLYLGYFSPQTRDAFGLFEEHKSTRGQGRRWYTVQRGDTVRSLAQITKLWEGDSSKWLWNRTQSKWVRSDKDICPKDIVTVPNEVIVHAGKYYDVPLVAGTTKKRLKKKAKAIANEGSFSMKRKRMSSGFWIALLVGLLLVLLATGRQVLEELHSSGYPLFTPRSRIRRFETRALLSRIAMALTRYQNDNAGQLPELVTLTGEFEGSASVSYGEISKYVNLSHLYDDKKPMLAEVGGDDLSCGCMGKSNPPLFRSPRSLCGSKTQGSRNSCRSSGVGGPQRKMGAWT